MTARGFRPADRVRLEARVPEGGKEVAHPLLHQGIGPLQHVGAMPGGHFGVEPSWHGARLVP